MKQINNIMKQIILPLYLLLVTITACSDEDSPLDKEQYIKQVYIVGADETTNMGMSVVDIPCNDSEEQMTYISVATGGSLNIGRDITVTVGEAGTEAIDDYNFKYLTDDDIPYRHLQASLYRIPDNRVTIKAGDIYGRMPIHLKSSAMHCDSLYALTFRISTVSDPGYISIRATDTVLIQTYNLVNDYSGTYQSAGYYYRWADGAVAGDSTTISATRTFKAVNANTVRFFHLASTESDDNIDAYTLTLKVNSDNSLTVEAWDLLNITDGGGAYSPKTGTFSVWYNYESGGTEYQFSGTFTKNEEL
jgi:hypothetical protein